MKKLFLAPIFIMLLFSCAKEQNELPLNGTVRINISHYAEYRLTHKTLDPNTNELIIDTSTSLKPLVFDTLIYEKTLGEKFSLYKLEYYLSNITFWRNDKAYYTADTIVYINARDINNSIILSYIPTGSYDKVTYLIGIGSNRNIHGYLPATNDNVNMEWPSSMGGGYHFMKMEGYWKNNTTHKIQSGFAMHIGSNGYAAYGEYRPMNFKVISGNVNVVNFRMNVNEWWRSPNLYSLDINGNNYTMGDTAKMRQIKENGMNAFDIYQ